MSAASVATDSTEARSAARRWRARRPVSISASFEIDLRACALLDLHLHGLVQLADQHLPRTRRVGLGRRDEARDVRGSNTGAALAQRQRFAGRSDVQGPANDLAPRAPLPAHFDRLFEVRDVLQAAPDRVDAVRFAPRADDQGGDRVARQDQAGADVSGGHDAPLPVGAADEGAVDVSSLQRLLQADGDRVFRARDRRRF